MTSFWVLRTLAKRWLGGRRQAPRRARRPRSARPSLEHLECRLAPAVDSWTGMHAAADGLYHWSDPANWSRNLVPVAGDDLNFPGGVPTASLKSVNDLPAGTAFNSLTFSGSGYDLQDFQKQGHSIKLNSTASTGVLIGANPAGTNNTIEFNIQLGATAGSLQFFSVNTLGADLTLTGSLSSPAGQSGSTLAKDGDGTLTLAADNSAFNGPVTVESGVLQIQNAKALGTGTATVLYDSSQPQHSGQLQLSGGIGPVANQLILNGFGPDANGALFNAGGTNTVSGNIVLDSDAAIGAFASSTNTNGVLTVSASTLVLNGQISDTGSGHNLSKEGLGQVILDPLGHANGNVYRGNTIVDNGTLTIRHSLALGQGPGNGAAATAIVNSTPNQSGTLQLEFVPAGPTRNWIDPNATSSTGSALDGFNVPNEKLILNGPGFEGIHVFPRTGQTAPVTTTSGALNNKAGNNSWAQAVTLWSGSGALSFDPLFWGDSPLVQGQPVGLGPTVGIGAEANSTLTLNGPIGDFNGPNNSNPNKVYSLIKTRPGRVVFTDANTFYGKTEVLDGALNIRDSQALGSATNKVFVFPGASLELQGNAKPGGDSVTGTANLSVGNLDLTLVGHGFNNEGALLNISGRNQWNGQIHLQSYLQRTQENNNASLPPSQELVTFTSDGAAIGVNADPGPFDNNGVPLTSLGYSQLTVNGLIDDGTFSQQNFPTANFFKVGAPGPVQANGTRDSGGELVLTDANSYLGVTDIQSGWITARNSQALGGNISSLKDIDQTPYLPAATINAANQYGTKGLADTLQPGTIVENGASLVLKTDLNGNPIHLYENLVLSGDGITHRVGANNNYFWLNQVGALLNLEGDNAIGGVNTDPSNRSAVGDVTVIGQAGIGAEKDETGQLSQLTLQGTTNQVKPLWADVNQTGTPGSGIDKLGSQRVIFQGPGTYTGPVNVKAGVLRIQNDTALGTGVGTTTVSAGASLELKGSAPIETGGVGRGIQVTGETLVLNGPGNTTAPSNVANAFQTAALENLSADNLWRGPVTFASDTTIGVEQESRLSIYGAIGDSSANGAGFTKVGIDNATEHVGTGELDLAGNNSYRGMTQVQAGTLSLQSNGALGAASTPTVFTVTPTSPSFTLNFNNNAQPTGSLPGNPTAANAQVVQSALQSLPTVLDAGGQVSVSASGNSYLITLGGNLTGFDQSNLLTASGATVATQTPGTGGVVTSGTAGIQLQGNITIAGKSLQTLNTGSPSSLNITPVATWFPQGPAPVLGGQTPGNQPVAGRVDGVSVDPTDPNTIYVDTAGGGAWKSIDGGQTWRPLTDEALTDSQVSPTGGGGTTSLPGILHWWKAEGDAVDSAGTDNGILTGVGGFGDVSFAPGERGQGFRFLGDDSFVQFGPEDFGTSDFSVGFFVSTVEKKYQTILGTRATDTVNSDGNFFGVRMTAAGQVEVTFDSQDPVSGQFEPLQVTSHKIINDGAFHYVTITRGPGSGGLSTVSIYIDGALDNTGSLQAPTNLNNGNPFNVGWEAADDNPAPPNNVVNSFTGVIDEIQVYDRALSAPEVSQLDTPPPSVNAAQVMFGGTLQVAPANPEVVYATTGDANNGPDSFYGAGIYMSRDGGRTWKLLQGNLNVNEFAGATISKLVVDLLNPFTVYVAVSNNGVNGTASDTAGIWYCSNTSAANPVWINLAQYESTTRQQNKLPPGPDDQNANNFTTTDDYTDVEVSVDQAPDALPGSRFIVFAIGNPDGGYSKFPEDYAVNGAYAAHLVLGLPDAVNPAYPSFSAPDIPAGWSGWQYDNFAPLTETIPYSVDGSSITNGPLPGVPGSYKVIGAAFSGMVKTALGPTFSGSTFTFYGTIDYPTPYPAPYAQNVFEGASQPGGNDLLKGTFREMRSATINWHPNTGLWDIPGWGAATVNAGMSNIQGPLGHGQGPYANTIIADPNNRQRVFVAGIGSQSANDPNNSGPWMSTDGASSTGNWFNIGVGADGKGPHANVHAMSFDNLGRLLVATDGGVWRLDNATPGSIHWTDLNGNLADLQINSAVSDPTDPFQAWAGMESNGLAVYNGDNGNLAWNETDTGNGGPVVVDIKNPLNVYHIQDGILRKSTDGGQTWSNVFTVQSGANTSPTYYPYIYYYPQFAGAFFNTQQPSDLNSNQTALGQIAGENQGYNAPANLVSNNIQVPLVIDPTNTSRLVIAGPQAGTPNLNGHYGNQPWESIQGGASGTFVSLDPNNQILGALDGLALAQNQGPLQGQFQEDPRFPLVTDQGANTYVPDTIYALTATGVWVTKNHGVNWVLSNGTGNQSLAASNLAAIAVDPRDEDIAYVVRDAGAGGGSHVYMTTDAGQHWTAIDGSLPGGSLPDLATWAVTIDPKTGEVFIGNDDGVYASTNTVTLVPGSPPAPNLNPTWKRFGVGMPHTQVKQITIDPTNDRLTAGTYGRSMFELFLDDSRANGGAIRAVSGSSVWTGPVTLTGNAVLRAEQGAQVNFVGNISNDSAGDAFTFTKVGPGTVVLSGDNSYGGSGTTVVVNGNSVPGDTDVKEGVLVVHNPMALGSTASGTIVESGAALELQSDVIGEPLQLNGNGIAFNGHPTGALRNVSNDNTYSGPITLNTNSTIGVDSGSQLTVTGGIGDGSPSNGYSLTKELTGTLVLQAADSYTGLTTVEQGALNIQNPQALVSTLTPAVVVKDGAALELQGGVTVAGEALALSGTGINDTGALLSTGGSNTWAGPITLEALPGFSPETSPAGVVAFGASDPADVLTVATNLQEQEPTGVSKVGPGTVVLAQANSYSGTTYVTDGILTIQDPKALGTPNTLEIQRVTVGGDRLGSFTLTLNGQTTDPKNHPLPYGATAQQVQGALDALPNVGSGNTTVTLNTATLPDGNTVFVYTVEFIGTLTGFNEPQMVATGLNGTTAMASTVADGGIGTQVLSGATLALDLDPNNQGLSPTVSGETLDLNGVGAARPAPLTAGALQDATLGALDNLSGNNTWSASVTLDTTTPGALGPQTDAIGVDGGSLTLGGTVQDPTPAPFTAATLEKVGTGSLFFPVVNTYQGNTQVIDGVLSVAAGTNAAGNSALGAPISSETETVTVLGGTGSFTLTFQGQTTSSLAYNATAAQVQSALDALSTIGGAGGSVTVTQSGNVYTITFGGTLAGQNLDPANGTALTASASGGAQATVATTVQGGLGATSVAGAGTLQMAGDITISGEPLSLSGDGAPSGGSNLGALDSAANSANIWDDTVTLNGPASVGAETLATLTLDQAIGQSQAGSTLTKFGFGTVAFTGPANNTYTGTTFVDDGVLDLNKSGGALALDGNVVIGDGTAGQTQGDVVRLEAGNQIISTATVAVNGDGLFDLNDQAQALAGLTITDGTVTTGGGTHGAQTGQLTLNGSLNMAGGTLSIAAPGAAVTLAGSGTAPDVAATSDNASGNAAIIGQGTLALGATDRQFQVTHGPDPLDLQVSAPIGGSAGLVKTGNGVMELTGVNTYTGTTTVTAGSLFVDKSSNSTGTLVGPTSLNGGLLGGTGTVAGITATAAGGTLAPGASPGGTPGVLTATGDVTLNGATSFQVTLNGSTPGNGSTFYSQLVAQGNVNLNGAAVTGSVATSSFVPAVGQAFTVIKLTGSGGETGTFATPTEFLSGIKFSNTYNSNSVVLTRIKANVSANMGAGTTPGVQYVAGSSPSQAKVTFTAQVTPEAGATFGSVAGEKVDFLDGRTNPATDLGQATVNGNGVATLTLPVSGPGSLDALAGVGLHMVYVHFAGDSNFNPGDSAPTDFGGLSVQTVTPNKSQAVLSANGGFSSAVITFTQPVSSLPLAQLSLTDPNGNAVSLAGATLTPNAAKTVWTLSGFAAQTTAGVYRLTVGPNVTDGSGFPMDQNANGLYGENGVNPAGDQFADPIVVDGLAVTAVAPVGPVLDETGLSTFTITFNMAVDANNNAVGTKGFGPSSLTLTGPGGAIPLIDGSGHLVSGVTLTPDATDKVWTVTFPKQQALGTYTLTVGPDVYDRAGDQMNQNYTAGNTTFGEPGFAPAGDEFKDTVLVTGLKVTALAPAHPVLDGSGLSSATFTFNEAVSTIKTAGGYQAFGPGSLTLTDPNGNVLKLIDASGNLAAGVTLTPNGAGTVWTVTFPAQHTPGDYFLAVGPNVLDTVGSPMDQNQNGVGGETSADVFTGGLVVDGLAVTGLAPTQAVSNGPGLSSATITFNEPVDTTPTAGGYKGFGPTSLVLKDPTGASANLIDANGNLAPGVTLTPNAAGTVWTVTFPARHTPGSYTLTVGPDVFDRAGFAMNQNVNTAAGEAGVAPTGDAFAGTLRVAGLKVTGLGGSTTVLDGNGLTSATIDFNEPVSSFPLADVTLTDPHGNNVPLTGAQLTPNSNDTVWTLSFPGHKQTLLGNYTLTVKSNATTPLLDANGFALDQNQNGVPGEASDVFTGTLAVAGLQVVSASPTGTVTSDPGLSSFTLTFNEALGAAGLNGQVQVSGPNGPVQGLTFTGGGTTWQVSFPNQSALGTYTLTVLPGLKDAAGNLLDQNGNLTGGEAGDQFSVQATVVPTPYVGIVGPEQASVLFGPLTPVFKRVGRRMVRIPGRFTQTVQLFNTGQQPIEGPFSLVLVGLLPVKRVHRRLVSRVHVLNAAGFGANLFPGAPFVTDVLSAQQLGSFEGASFVINLQVTGSGTPTFTPIIVAGLVP